MNSFHLSVSLGTVTIEHGHASAEAIATGRKDATFPLRVVAYGRTVRFLQARSGKEALLQGSVRVQRGEPLVFVPEIILGAVEGGYVNHASLVGKPGCVPHFQRLENNNQVANFRMAVKRIGDKDNSDWFNVALFGEPAYITSRYVAQGSNVGVTGILEFDKYGTRINGTQIYLLGKNAEEE